MNLVSKTLAIGSAIVVNGAAWAHPVQHSPGQAAPVSIVGRANRASRLEPAADRFVSAVQVYPWSEGALFQLFTAPGQISDIALQPGENLVAVAAGDTVRWIVGDTTSGAGETKRTHVLVKPSATGLSTNLVITTDRRSYHLELASTTHTAMAAVSWTYPADALLSLKGDPTRVANSDRTAGLDVAHLFFGYAITGSNEPWRPVRAFDDGRQTFIEFPPTLTTSEAPPLFVVDPTGAATLVNYRIQGHFYVVDRLFDAAELRLGTKHQQIVRISRLGTHSDKRRGA